MKLGAHFLEDHELYESLHNIIHSCQAKPTSETRESKEEEREICIYRNSNTPIYIYFSHHIVMAMRMWSPLFLES